MKIKKLIWLVILELLGFGIAAASAQTVSPVIVECGKKCRGQFTVSNASIQPMSVVVEPRSFTLESTGQPTYKPLDATTILKLSEASARIAPKGQHTFGYEVHCEKFPCALTLYSATVVGHTDEGVAVKAWVPHTVYVCEKAKGCRDSVRRAAGVK